MVIFKAVVFLFGTVIDNDSIINLLLLLLLLLIIIIMIIIVVVVVVIIPISTMIDSIAFSL